MNAPATMSLTPVALAVAGEFDLNSLNKGATGAVLADLGYKADWARATVEEMRLILATRTSEELFTTLMAKVQDGWARDDFTVTETTARPFDVGDALTAVRKARAARLERGTAGSADTFVDRALATLGLSLEPLTGPQGSEKAAAAPTPAATEEKAASEPAKPAAAPLKAAPTTAAAKLAAVLAEAMAEQAQGAPVDAEEVRALVSAGIEPTRDALGRLAAEVLELREALANTQAGGAPATLTVQTADGATLGKLDGEHTHPAFAKVLALVAAGLNVMLVGPAGSGKTHLAEQVARALGRDFGSLSFTAGASEAQLAGWLLPTGDGGRFEYAPSQFVRLFEGGNSLFLFDEMDRGDANMLVLANSALSNDFMNVPQRREAPTVRRGKGAAVVAACNTFGTGQDYVYAGANVLDGATLDRFYVVPVDYDAAFEARIAGLPAPQTAAWATDNSDPAADCQDLHAWLGEVRRKATAAKLARIVSTRMLQKGIAARCAGVPLAEVKRDLLAGWTRDELNKVGVYA